MADTSQWEIETPGERPRAPGVRDVFRFLIANFFLLAGGLGLGLLLGWVVYRDTPKAYEAKGAFVVDEIPFIQTTTTSTSDAETERQVVQTLILSIPNREMRGAVERRLQLPAGRIAFAELDPPLKLEGPNPRARVRVSPVRNSRMGSIEATSQFPDFAAAVVNAMLDELQLYNTVGGRFNNIQISLNLAKSRAENLLKQLLDVTAQRIKFEQEKAELDNYLLQNLPLASFPAFARDSTLNNLKTQLILIESEYDNIASSSTRGARLVGKKSELQALKGQLVSYAERLASGLRSEYEISSTQEKNMQADMLKAKDQIDKLTQQATRLAQSFGDPRQMRTLAAEVQDGPTGPSNTIVVVDRATAPAKPAKPKLLLNFLLGGAFGGALGLGLAALRTLLDNRIKCVEQIESRIGVPCLAALPRRLPLARGAAKKNVFDHPRYPVGLGFLCSHLLAEHVPGTGCVFGFTPAGASRRPSSLVADLAILLAQAEKKTLVVDLHLASPRVAQTLGITVKKGLLGWLASDEPPGEFITYSAVRELAVFSPEKSARDVDDLLSRRPLITIMPELAAHWDFILIDSPAILSDWSLTLALPPGSPLIITAVYLRTRTNTLRQTLAHTRGPRWKVNGVVLLDAPRRQTI